MTDISNSSVTGRHLRFGIMCSGLSFPAWQARCIEQLLTLKGVKPVLLIIDDNPRFVPPIWQRAARLMGGKTLLWRLYERVVLSRASRATKPVDLSPVLGNLPVIRCRVERMGKYSQRFLGSDLIEIRNHKLDFVLRFAFNIIRGEILSAARYGVWSFHHDDPDKYRGVPPGFWEIYQGDPVTGAMLQRLTDRLDAGVILYRGHFKTLAYSYPQSLDAALFGSADWPARVCKDIQNGIASYLGAAPSSTEASLYRDPNSLQMMRFGWLSAKAWGLNQINSLFRHQQWNIGIIETPVHEIMNLAKSRPSGFVSLTVHWLPEIPGRFLADPFALAQHEDHKNGLTILAEEYDWSQERGHISVIESPNGRRFSPPCPAIECTCHLSYPFLFQYDSMVYCVPESSEAREVLLYRAGSSLREWSKVATLVRDFPGVDSTVFHHNGRWWLFCTSEDAGPNDTLFGWYADELTGPWVPHAGNPLKTDVRSSRPAGSPFVHDGELYRPAQDCSLGYGAAVVLNRVNCLTPEDFSEEVAFVLKPDPSGPYSDGLHTICGIGKYTIIDGARRTFVRRAFIGSIAKKAVRLLPNLRGRAQAEQKRRI